MIVNRIGTVKEYLDGRLDIEFWIVDDCDYPPSETETQELIKLAKENGTYTYCFSS